MNENKANTGIYINGKEQALEILKLLTPQERARILNSINVKNPSLANELKQNSINERDIEQYPISSFTNIFRNINPEVLGLALQGTSTTFQKDILRAAPRNYAEKAFKTLTLTLPTSKTETITRAKKIIIAELTQIA